MLIGALMWVLSCVTVCWGRRRVWVCVRVGARCEVLVEALRDKGVDPCSACAGLPA